MNSARAANLVGSHADRPVQPGLPLEIPQALEKVAVR